MCVLISNHPHTHTQVRSPTPGELVCPDSAEEPGALHRGRLLDREESRTAGGVESEWLTFDLCHVSIQLLPRRLQLLPLSQQPTSSLLQLLVQLQVPTTLLELQLHIRV
ncbi:uncharacterized [Lates japonicus]